MLKYFVHFTVIISGIFFLTTSDLKAQNINDALRVAIPGFGSNARALGMGNSYIALSDDGSASFFNPAGFGLLKRLEFTGGLNYSNFNNDVSFLGKNTSYSNSNTKLNRLSFAFPFPTLRGSLVFGLSYHNTKNLTSAMKFDGFNNGNTSWIREYSLSSNEVPYQLYLSYPLYDNDNNYLKDTTNIFGRLNQSGSIITSGDINNWTLSGAIEIYKNLFLGLNLNIISGTYKSTSDYYEDDTQDIYQNRTDPSKPQTADFKTFFINRIIDWDISGWDAKFGLLYQLQNNARFGLTIQFPKSFKIKEKFLLDSYSEFGTGFSPTYQYDDAVEFDIITPFEISGGASVNYMGLIFSAQTTFIDYTETEYNNLTGFSNPEKQESDLNRDIKDNLKSVFNYNLGIEYNIPVIGLRLRGGFMVMPSPYKDDPPEFDRKYLTAGLGFLTDETIGIDIAYVHGWWKDFGDNYSSNVSRTFHDVKSSQFIITGIYRF
jgi:long-subunit fatty acid transport protein